MTRENIELIKFNFNLTQYILAYIKFSNSEGRINGPVSAFRITNKKINSVTLRKATRSHDINSVLLIFLDYLIIAETHSHRMVICTIIKPTAD